MGDSIGRRNETWVFVCAVKCAEAVADLFIDAAFMFEGER